MSIDLYWSCNLCNYKENIISETECEICGTPVTSTGSSLLIDNKKTHNIKKEEVKPDVDKINEVTKDLIQHKWWTCSSCTYINKDTPITYVRRAYSDHFSKESKCSMCNTYIVFDELIQNKWWTCNFCSFCNKNGSTICSACREVKRNLPWKCLKCHFINPEDENMCLQCFVANK